jgi:GNAT superfamily N-acetyltransferase
MMSELRFAVGDADADLAERLDKEISAFNAAATGHHDGRMLSVAVRGDGGDLRAGLYGWTWGGCGYIDLLWVRDDQRGRGLGAGLLAAAEAEIRRRGCDRVALSTHSSRHRVSTPGAATPNAAARRVIRTATTTSTW